jgi:polar amino acid transport system substrate-binding protein
LNKVAGGEIDIALDGISITHDRLSRMNFSQPYKNSGQRIMVPYMGKVSIWSQIIAYVGQFFRWEILFALVAFIINCFFWGTIVWIVERFFWRRSHPSPDGSKEIVHLNGEQPNIVDLESGTLAAFDAGTTIGYGRFYPVTRVGQLVIVAAFFCGAIVVGNVISTLTTDKIVHRLEGAIRGPDDLKGKRVAVVNGTTSEKVAAEYNPGSIQECDDFYKAVVQLRLGEADAVVADDPVILNYLKNHPTHGSTAGLKFHPEDYGIAFAPHVEPELVKTFSIAIARLRETGKLRLIEHQWFGE